MSRYVFDHVSIMNCFAYVWCGSVWPVIQVVSTCACVTVYHTVKSLAVAAYGAVD